LVAIQHLHIAFCGDSDNLGKQQFRENCVTLKIIFRKMRIGQIKTAVIGSCIVMALLIALSCKKRVIVMPEACMHVDKTEVHVGDTVTFTNCSLADHTHLSFFTGETAPEELSSFQFDASGKYRTCFYEPGTVTALLKAINPNAPIMEQRFLLTVKP
jgi:hypothetical protein